MDLEAAKIAQNEENNLEQLLNEEERMMRANKDFLNEGMKNLDQIWVRQNHGVAAIKNKKEHEKIQKKLDMNDGRVQEIEERLRTDKLLNRFAPPTEESFNFNLK